MPALVELLYMALSGLAGWGITRTLDKKDDTIVTPVAKTDKPIDFVKELKTIGLLTAGCLAVFFFFKITKIKVFKSLK